MKFVFTILVLIFLSASCGKKSEPQYRALINNFTKIT